MSGHQKMLMLLKDIKERAPNENSFQGDGEARRLRAQLAALPEKAPAKNRVEVNFHLGVAELFLGHERKAIEHLSTAQKLLSTMAGAPAEVANQVNYRLGLAYMRLGETQNCCLRHTAESCILPIQGDGVHTQQEGSKQAITCFATVLQNTPENSRLHLSARWLLNIAYMTIGGYPDAVPKHYLIPPQAFESDEEFPHFTNIAPQLGLDTFSLAGGAIADDFDNDDYLDLVVSTSELSGQIRFFLNNRDGTFSDHTEEAGLVGLYGGLNLVQGDYDNDGDVDVFVLRGAWFADAGQHPKSLLRNNGNGTFEDVTFEAGLGDAHYPSQTGAWADYDNDGDLDLYIGNESTDRLISPCQLFRNNGDGTFTDVAQQAGVTNYGFAKAVVWGDYDGERFPDLYVSNLGGANRLYRNNGDGTFTDVAPELGITGPRASFPAWFWDFDNDGVLDLFVSAYSASVADLAAAYLHRPFNTELARLYRGNGRGGFEDVARQKNLIHPTRPMGANFGDIDNDGYLDFYLGTGDPDYESLMPNVMYHNHGGKSFADVTMASGLGHLQKGHAISFADFDNDGDQDIFEQMGGAYLGDKFSDCLYESPGFGNHWITVKCVGMRSNRSAIGARIRVDVVEKGEQRTIYKYVNSGGSFGANPLRQTIGLGKATKIERLEVFWPTTGKTQTFADVPLDKFIKIVEGQDRFTTLQVRNYTLGKPLSKIDGP